jgi:hypothetical protein
VTGTLRFGGGFWFWGVGVDGAGGNGVLDGGELCGAVGTLEGEKTQKMRRERTVSRRARAGVSFVVG